MLCGVYLLNSQRCCDSTFYDADTDTWYKYEFNIPQFLSVFAIAYSINTAIPHFVVICKCFGRYLKRYMSIKIPSKRDVLNGSILKLADTVLVAGFPGLFFCKLSLSWLQLAFWLTCAMGKIP